MLAFFAGFLRCPDAARFLPALASALAKAPPIIALTVLALMAAALLGRVDLAESIVIDGMCSYWR